MYIALAVTSVYLWRSNEPKATGGEAAIRSIAVLPFKPLVADSRDESFEMGMADTLIFRLSSIKGIVVRPISAVRKYADLNQDPLAAGREQQVDAVLDSSIQMLGEKIRVTARLVRVADGSVLWTDKSDQQFADLFAVQDAIAEKLTGSLALKLTDEERRRLTKRYTENTEAYQLYLKGRYYQWIRRTEESYKKSIECFEQAITKDPNYALAYAGLSESYSFLGNYNLLPPKEVSPRAEEAALKALKLDDELAEAHIALAYVRMNYYWDWASAEREFKRAIELNPGSLRAHSLYAWYLTSQGRFGEGLAEIRRAVELDPLSVDENSKVGWHLLMAGREDEAIEQLQRVLDLDPNFGATHQELGLVYEQQKRYQEAIAEFQKLRTLFRDVPSAIAALGHAYALAGKRSEAQGVLNELKELAKQKYVSSYDMAVVYMGLGEKGQAMAWLEKAYERRDGWLAGWVKVDPRFDGLRSDPRFQDLLRRIGLAP